MINDYKKEDGDSADFPNSIDWKAYHKAQTDNGERCYRCGEFILNLFGSKGRPQLCSDCQSLEEEVYEVIAKNLRCPYCKEIFDPIDYAIWDEGEYNIKCPKCHKEFEVETNVEYTFTSPALMKEE